MYKKGYLRYLVSTPTAGSRDVSFYKNGELLVKHTIVTKYGCDGYKLLKWLDNNGQYRFFPFLSEHSIKDNPKQIGEVSNFIESLITAISDKSNLGYTNERKLTLRQVNVTEDERLILSSLFTSPKVYLYVGDYIDFSILKYIEVTITCDNVVKKEKGKSSTFEITVNLPKHFTITQL